jgi:hypothetical protein
MLVLHLVGELAVIDLVVVPADALLRHARRAACLKDVERLALERGRHPDLRLQIAKPFILEMREFLDVLHRLHFLARVEILLGPVQPERAARFRREMPVDDLLQVRVQGGLRCLNLLLRDGLFAHTVYL